MNIRIKTRHPLRPRLQRIKGVITRILDPKTVRVQISLVKYSSKFKRYSKCKKAYLCHVTEDLTESVGLGKSCTIADCRPVSTLKHKMVILVNEEV
jgi:ribosomal protein S17